jgi:hypothetical protein
MIRPLFAPLAPTDDTQTSQSISAAIAAPPKRACGASQGYGRPLISFGTVGAVLAYPPQLADCFSSLTFFVGDDPVAIWTDDQAWDFVVGTWWTPKAPFFRIYEVVPTLQK